MNKEFYVVLIRTIFFNISTSYAFVKAKKREKINSGKNTNIFNDILITVLLLILLLILN